MDVSGRIAGDAYDIYGADFARCRVDFVQIWDDGLLVRNGDIESA